jgi:FemAB-related protein (PEP-CTERM system-associated)
MSPVRDESSAVPTFCTITIESEPPGDWDDYVRGHPRGTAYHLAPAVSIGKCVFGLPTRFLVARGDGRIRGILPLVEQSSFLFGHFLTSLPFFTYGGMLVDDDAAATGLREAAQSWREEINADHIELRHVDPGAGGGLPQRLDKVSMVLPLPDSEAELSKALGSKLRSQIKRGDREQPAIKWGRHELVTDFYRVYSVGMRDLGTPVYPLRFFHTVLETFGDQVSVMTVQIKGKVEAAAILLRHGSVMEVPWAAASDTAKRTSVNMRMYWELLCHSVACGAGEFDFGRSTAGSGTYRFKSQWGAKPRQLHWHYILPPGKSVPMLNQTNSRYALAAALWKRLPLWCANLIGPQIIRNLP